MNSISLNKSRMISQINKFIKLNDNEKKQYRQHQKNNTINHKSIISNSLNNESLAEVEEAYQSKGIYIYNSNDLLRFSTYFGKFNA